MPNDGIFIALAASAILLSVASLGPLGARAEQPGRSKTTGYPAVEDVPPRPEKPAMTADEQLKLKKELSATRDRHTATGKARGGAARVGPLKPYWLTTIPRWGEPARNPDPHAGFLESRRA